MILFSDLPAAGSQPEKSVQLLGDQVTKGVFREDKAIAGKQSSSSVLVFNVVTMAECFLLGDLLEHESQWGALKIAQKVKMSGNKLPAPENILSKTKGS